MNSIKRQFRIKSITNQDKAWIRQFMCQEWHAELIVAHKKIYYPDQLDGFIAWMEARRVGLITCQIRDTACEIVTLNSLVPAIGIGTALIESVKTVAGHNHCSRIWLITTTDNLSAPRFYQKRGFRPVRIYHDSVKYARQIKSIPEIGKNGIPIRDELELELKI